MLPRKSILILLFAFLAACSGREDTDLQLYSAASLTDAVHELCALWNATDSVKVSPVLASSSTLARQIVQGAPADLYLSASSQWMDHVESKSGRVLARRDLLSNRLALIVPPGNPIGIKAPGDLADRRLQRLSVGDPGHVPVGIYAKAWLEEAGLWDAVADRLLPARDVRVALAYVERGEADAGIVYASDAKSAGLEPVALADPPADMPIRYPFALLAGPGGEAPPPAAERLYRWLQSEEALEVFLKHGFLPLWNSP